MVLSGVISSEQKMTSRRRAEGGKMKRTAWGLLVLVLAFGRLLFWLRGERRWDPGKLARRLRFRHSDARSSNAWNQGKVDVFLEGYWKSDGSLLGSQALPRLCGVQDRYR